ncbi:MAG: RdgB/HAM1 family non-canonical purine NTP pyrophosphatase [Hahellaceae bacterium]|nr:RdgB/HAM1 family non-canonical purine NTP pyrophosphatase [Hahellaceae bacterium]MCP5168416.1 RdgB/HAM1 family non-canonical purine NTP pyrophosphatase [Hahellaceae bacterium]
MNIVLASSNKGKISELNALLDSVGLKVVPQSEFAISDADEAGLTFVENALIKARHASRESGLPAIADDSGLEVDALQGAPGIYSARYAGRPTSDERNNEKLLNDLSEISEPHRTARYHCVLVYLQHAEDPTPLICHGVWEGEILTRPQGNGGFGYDPLFWVASEQCSAAELSPDRKNALSHRGHALQKLLTALPAKVRSL